MKKFTKLRVLALALCLALMLSACAKAPFDFDFDLPFDLPFFGTTEGGGQAEEEKRERRTIPYSQMEYQRPDMEAIQAEIGQLTEDLKKVNSFDALMELDDRLGEIGEEFNTMHTLASLKKYHDSSDTFYEEEYRYLEDQSVELTTLYNNFNRLIVEGPYADDYKAEVGNYVYQSILDSLLLDSEAVQEYKKERARLNADYNKKLSTLSVEYEGQSYTIDDLYTVDSMALYMQLTELLFNANAAEFTEMYARMVELDKQTAHTLGFESAADMYYLSYSRDYTKEDALALCQNVKDNIVPLMDTLNAYYFDPGPMEMATTLEKMPAALETVSPELGQAFEFMQQYGLNDLEALPEKQSGIAFTTSISAYDAPFVFMSWDEGMESLTTLTHEFGHFYDFWLHYDEDVVFNLDVAETYSQGLELLMHPQYGHFTADEEAAWQASMSNLQRISTGALVYQCVLEEFQLRAYELDTFDSVILGRLFSEVLSEYGYGGYSLQDSNGADNTWFTTTHLFDTPFYTISYVTSATAALQIWAESQQDWQGAVDTYLELIHEDQNQDYNQLLAGAGLKPPHDAGVMREIAANLQRVFGQLAPAA